MHINSIVRNSIEIISQKTLYHGGIRKRVFCSWGGCDVHKCRNLHFGREVVGQILILKFRAKVYLEITDKNLRADI
jgi:hypothetical protein